jgi:hypothetical protein
MSHQNQSENFAVRKKEAIPPYLPPHGYEAIGQGQSNDANRFMPKLIGEISGVTGVGIIDTSSTSQRS